MSAASWVQRVFGRPGPLPLRLLVLALPGACDQRCRHCQVWVGEGGGAGLTRAERLALVDEAIAGGVEAVLLTGGEPLHSADFEPVAARLRGAGVRVLLATSGGALAERAAAVAALVDEAYVSLDGDAPAVDALRGAGTFERVARGLQALRAVAPHLPRVARCVVQARNVERFPQTVAAARALGFHRLSFLPLDVRSSAFGGRPELRRRLLPTPDGIDGFERAVRAHGCADGFVLEGEAGLLRIARHLRASVSGATPERPPCDAPRWSLVVEADGAVRPCFFQAPVGDARGGLGTLRASPRFAAALEGIARPNEACLGCVCPKLGAPVPRRATA